MKILRLLSLITLLILFPFLINIYANIKAVQISYIECKNLYEFEKELEKIKSDGYNTVIFRVFNNKGDRIYPFIPEKYIKNKVGVYFKTNHYPVVYNLLPEVIKLCHKHNLKIVAWLTTRYLDFNCIDKRRKVFKFDFEKNKIVESKGLSFFNEKNIHLIINIYEDLIKNNIDGILLQDDLKILIDEDFNKNAIEYFYKKTGIKLSNRNIKSFLYKNAAKRYFVKKNKNLEIWNSLKANQINHLINSITTYCNNTKKVLFLMDVTYEALSRPDLSKLWYSYNLQTLQKTSLDYYSVMLYQKQISKELNLNYKETINFIKKLIINYKKLSYKNKFIFKIQVFDWDSNKFIKKNNINKLFTFFAKNNIENTAIFPYKKGLNILK